MSAWVKHVTATYNAMKKKNKDAKLGDAMKAAKKTYKKPNGTRKTGGSNASKIKQCREKESEQCKNMVKKYDERYEHALKEFRENEFLRDGVSACEDKYGKNKCNKDCDAVPDDMYYECSEAKDAVIEAAAPDYAKYEAEREINSMKVEGGKRRRRTARKSSRKSARKSSRKNRRTRRR